MRRNPSPNGNLSQMQSVAATGVFLEPKGVALDDRQLSCALNATSSHYKPGVAGHSGQVLICFSHLRWDFVFQRPQHLMTRFAKGRRVLFWEEPVSAPADAKPALEQKVCQKSGVVVLTPQIPDHIQG